MASAFQSSAFQNTAFQTTIQFIISDGGWDYEVTWTSTIIEWQMMSTVDAVFEFRMLEMTI